MDPLKQRRLERLRREKATRSFSAFIHYNNDDYQENWHHTKIIEALESVVRGDIKKLMVFVPPQNGKSEIASINFPAYFFGLFPKKAVIASSYNQDLAVSFGRKARNLVDSATYKNLFTVALAEDTKAAGVWMTNQGGEYTAVGIGGGTTGRRADIFLIDDPVKDKQEAESQVIQERNIGWYRSVARTRLSPTGAIVVIQTRWHDQDLAGQILETEDGWTVISLPAIATHDEEFRKTGEALWPKRYSLAWLQDQAKALGSELWSALYQQTPLSEESQVFKRTMFRYREYTEIADLNTRCFVTIDPAPAKTESSDFIGVCINWVDEANKWNLKAYKIKFDALALINLLFSLYSTTRFESVGIEKGIYKDVIKPFLDEEMLKRNVFFTVLELDHGGIRKELRIKGLQPRYESGQIFHLKGFCDDLEAELLRFPKSVHDDVMDATAYQLQIAEKPEGMLSIELEHQRRERVHSAQKDAGL